MLDLKKIDSNICKFNIALFLRSILMLTPILLLFYQYNGLTVQELFFFQGLFYLTSILSEIPIGYISDRISRKHLLLISFSLFMFVTVFWLFTTGYYVVLIGEIIFAISKVMMDNAMPAYLYDYLHENNRKEQMSKYYGYLNFYLALGTTIAAILGTIIYSKYGFNHILILEFIFISISITLTMSLPKIKSNSNSIAISNEKIYNYLDKTKKIYSNPSIRYHILYSGILTAFSIFFVLCFQPVMQNALFPIFMFGIVACTNHGIRALAGITAGKLFRNFDIRKLIKPLYYLYIIGFCCLYAATTTKNIVLISALIVILCLIIGMQLIFTILHVSRLQKFVHLDNRGNLMSINNLVSRSAAAIILLTSKFFITHVELQIYFIAMFLVYLILGTILKSKTYDIKD